MAGEQEELMETESGVGQVAPVVAAENSTAVITNVS